VLLAKGFEVAGKLEETFSYELFCSFQIRELAG
jgi:hypothetical protein